MKIIAVESIGPTFAEKPHTANIQTTDDLREAGRTPGAPIGSRGTQESAAGCCSSGSTM